MPVPRDELPPDAAGAVVAVVGAGFIGRGLVHRLVRRDDLAPPLVVNRHPEHAVAAFAAAGVDEVVCSDDPELVTAALAERRPTVTADADILPEVDGIDLVVEATGAVEHGTAVILAALGAGRHVVSMNAEADALLGHHMDAVAESAGSTYSIADGDQPGVLLRMIDEASRLGLEPVVALNCKRNLDRHQRSDDSRAYARRDGTSITMTTAFGDGTKMQIENVVTANLSGLRPTPIGTPGIRTTVATVAEDTRRAGVSSGRVHFTLGGDFGGGVVVLARSPDPAFDAPYLGYGKLGPGPWYPLFRPYHLIHMEVPTTIVQLLTGGPPVGRRTATPVATCVAVTKQALRAGQPLEGIGGDHCYGLAADTRDGEGLLPIGLAPHATLRRDLAADRPIGLEDVDVDEDAWLVRLHRAANGQGVTGGMPASAGARAVAG